MKTVFSAGDTNIKLSSFTIIGTAPQEHLELKQALHSVMEHLKPEAREELLGNLQASGDCGEQLYGQIAGHLDGHFGLIVDYAGSPSNEPVNQTQEAAKTVIKVTADLSQACANEQDWAAIAGLVEKLYSSTSTLSAELAPTFAHYSQFQRQDVPDLPSGEPQQFWLLKMPAA